MKTAFYYGHIFLDETEEELITLNVGDSVEIDDKSYTVKFIRFNNDEATLYIYL